MARPRNTTPTYLLHARSGQAIVVIEGRTIYLGQHGSPESLQAYAREVAEWRAHGPAGPSGRGVGTPITVADLVVAYWEHLDREKLHMRNGRSTSERLCLRVALRPVLRLYAGMPAAAFGPLQLIAVRGELSRPLPPPGPGEAKRRVWTGPIARSSVNNHIHRIRGVWRWAVSMQLVPVTTWEALRAVAGLRRGQGGDTVREPRRVQPAPLRSIAAVLRHVQPPVAALIRLQWLTGARPGEVLQMRLADIDRKGSTWTYRPASHKTEHHGHDREIYLGPKAQRVLAPFLRLDPAAWLFPGAGRGKNAGRHLREDGYCRAITRACEEAGVPRWTPHQLRHNAGTRYRAAAGIEAARVQLGHEDAGTTLIYAEADRRAAKALAQRLG